MEKEFRWPKKNDNPFLVKSVQFNSPTWASLQWLGLLKANDSIWANAYKKMADLTIKELQRGEGTQYPDTLFMPIAYNYRHCLELKMKHIINLGIKLEVIELNEKISLLLKGHSLHKLWNWVRKIIEENWENSPKDDLDSAERIIYEFHKLDESGQSFRYSEDLSGETSLKTFPESVDLTHLEDVFNAVFNFLDGCESGLDHDLEMKNDMLIEFGSY